MKITYKQELLRILNNNRGTEQSARHHWRRRHQAAAEAAAERKANKYSSLAQSYLFVPVAAETMGTINEDGMDFLSDLGRRIYYTKQWPLR